jgi:hypothetical protein
MSTRPQVQSPVPPKKKKKKEKKKVGFQWLMPITLATQEAEMRRITVQSQPRQIVCETLSQKKPITKKGLVEWLKV